MKYSFRDIMADTIYDGTRVMFITGPYSIFNNIVKDKLRDLCRPKDNARISPELAAEFGINLEQSNKNGNMLMSMNLTDFFDYSAVPNISGRWYCSVILENLSAKEIERIEKYIEKPNQYGTLVVESLEYKSYAKYLRSRRISNSKEVNLIQLSFPNMDGLKLIAESLFNKAGANISSEALDTFVFKMSDCYDDYDATITSLANGWEGLTINKKEIEELMVDIDNYVIDDLVRELVKDVGSNAVGGTQRKNRRTSIFRMAGTMVNDMGARELCKRLKWKIMDFLNLRIGINQGLIPVGVRYSVIDVKRRFPENNPITKIPDFRFRKMVYIASQASLENWLTIWLMLNNIPNDFASEEYYEHMIYRVIHRQYIASDYLMQATGIVSETISPLYEINSIPYMPEVFNRDLDILRAEIKEYRLKRERLELEEVEAGNVI